MLSISNPMKKAAWQRVQDQIASKFVHRAYNFQDVLLLLSRVKDVNLTYSRTQCSPSCDKRETWDDKLPLHNVAPPALPLKYSLVIQLRQHWWWPPQTQHNRLKAKASHSVSDNLISAPTDHQRDRWLLLKYPVRLWLESSFKILAIVRAMFHNYQTG